MVPLLVSLELLVQFGALVALNKGSILLFRSENVTKPAAITPINYTTKLTIPNASECWKVSESVTLVSKCTVVVCGESALLQIIKSTNQKKYLMSKLPYQSLHVSPLFSFFSFFFAVRKNRKASFTRTRTSLAMVTAQLRLCLSPCLCAVLLLLLYSDWAAAHQLLKRASALPSNMLAV